MISFNQIESREQFTILFDLYWEPLYLYAIKATDEAEEAKDLVQDLFAYLWIRRKKILVSGDWQSYLFSALKNRIFDFHKSRKKRTSINADSQIHTSNSQDILEGRLEMNQLSKKLRQLTTVQRIVFILYRLQGFSVEEISKRLSISENTVKTHIQKSTQKIRLLPR